MLSSVSAALLLAAIALAIAGMNVVSVGIICTVAVAFEGYVFYRAGVGA